MAEPSIAEQLKALRAGDDKAAGTLARAVTAVGDAKIRDLLAVLHGADKTEAGKAAGVLLEIDLPALPAVLAGVSPEPLDPLIWDIQLAADLVLSARMPLIANEPEEAQYLNSRLFLNLSNEKKDQEIFFAKRERRFTRFDEQ